MNHESLSAATAEVEAADLLKPIVSLLRELPDRETQANLGNSANATGASQRIDAWFGDLEAKWLESSVTLGLTDAELDAAGLGRLKIATLRALWRDQRDIHGDQGLAADLGDVAKYITERTILLDPEADSYHLGMAAVSDSVRLLRRIGTSGPALTAGLKKVLSAPTTEKRLPPQRP